MSGYGLVLAGGGGKGAYQIGAWKALRELGVTFDAIAGVSIGSINGALIAGGDFERAMEMWKSVSLDKGIKIDETLPDPENLFSKKNWPTLFKEVLKNGGIDASPAEDYISEYIDEKKIRESGIPLGIITVQMGQKVNGLELFIDEIPEGELVDYLLASSNIPLVTNIGPEGEKFLDGGVYDNTPIMTLKKRGYNKLIVIDISSIKGIAHNLDFSNSQVVYIKPFNIEDLGAAFDFEPELNEKRITLGYLDTKKAFGELAGNVYHFLPSVFRFFVKQYGADEVHNLELFANKLGVPKLEIYSQESFLSALKEAYEKEKAEIEAREKERENEKEKEREKGKFKAKIKKNDADSDNEGNLKVTDESDENTAQDKEEDNGLFGLFSLKNYFSQKKSPFESFEKAIEILENM